MSEVDWYRERANFYRATAQSAEGDNKRDLLKIAADFEAEAQKAEGLAGSTFNPLDAEFESPAPPDEPGSGHAAD